MTTNQSIANQSMIFKILDQSLDTCFELMILINKNKGENELNGKYTNLIQPWEIRFSLKFPTIGEDYVDFSATLYREIKKADIFNICELSTVYDYDGDYIEEAITFQHEPLKFKKFFVAAGFKYRLGLHVDHEFQDSVDEYVTLFKDVKYLDTFVEQMKALLRDSAHAQLDDIRNL